MRVHVRRIHGPENENNDVFWRGALSEGPPPGLPEHLHANPMVPEEEKTLISSEKVAPEEEVMR